MSGNERGDAKSGSRSSRGKTREPRPTGGSPASEARHEKVEQQLDEALAATFPASDPVSIVTSHEEEDRGEP